ncbi:hypothetical protein VULLAG_LOCUS17834 [Vulpes lagopus]
MWTKLSPSLAKPPPPSSGAAALETAQRLLREFPLQLPCDRRRAWSSLGDRDVGDAGHLRPDVHSSHTVDGASVPSVRGWIKRMETDSG